MSEQLLPLCGLNSSTLILNIQPDGGSKDGRMVENMALRVTLPKEELPFFGARTWRVGVVLHGLPRVQRWGAEENVRQQHRRLGHRQEVLPRLQRAQDRRFQDVPSRH